MAREPREFFAAWARSTNEGSLGEGRRPSQVTPLSLERSLSAPRISRSLKAIAPLYAGVTFNLEIQGSSKRIERPELVDGELMSTTDVNISTQGIVLTDAASVKVAALLAQEGRDDLALRVAVQPGGCSGLRYQLYFDDRNLDGDTIQTYGNVKVVTDKMSTPYLFGASIDFVDTIEKQG